jgi:methyl-accepting chemotaxis protein
LASVDAAATASRDAAAELGKTPGALKPHLIELTWAANNMAQAERDLVTASAASSKQIADALGASGRDLADASAASTRQIADTLAGGANEVRDSLGEVTSAAVWSASRAEVAADILGQAQQALIGLPGAVAELRTGVGDIGSQIMNLTDAITAAGNAADRLLTAVQQQSASAEPELQTDHTPARWPDLKTIDGQGGPNPPWNQRPRSK